MLKIKNNGGFTRTLSLVLSMFFRRFSSISNSIFGYRFFAPCNSDGRKTKPNLVFGFTLIELLVVIAIIGLLSTIVVVSLSSVRKKARDTKRVADIRSLQLAAEMYFDVNRNYPGSLAALAPLYISVIPTDPLSGSYSYSPLNTGCTGYHLGATLEEITNMALRSDVDGAVGTLGSGGSCSAVVGAVFDGTSASVSPAVCSSTPGTAQTNGTQTETCYDITN